MSWASTRAGGGPRWLNDGRRLVFSTFATTSRSALYLLDTRSKQVRELLAVAPNEIGQRTLSRDNRRIYFSLTSREADVWLISIQ